MARVCVPLRATFIAGGTGRPYHQTAGASWPGFPPAIHSCLFPHKRLDILGEPGHDDFTSSGPSLPAPSLTA